VRESLRLRHYSRRTELAYVSWIRRFVLFHGKRHPSDLGAAEVTAFLTHLATNRKVSASTQNQALAALLFLYTTVLTVKLPWLDGLVRAKRPPRLPVCLEREEVFAILEAMHGVPKLMATLLYGSGLRLIECCQLRVKDLDFAKRQILVRSGLGKSRRPGSQRGIPKRDHGSRTEAQHESAGDATGPYSLRAVFLSRPIGGRSMSGKGSRTVLVSLVVMLASCSHTSGALYRNALVNSQDFPPHVVPGDKCVLELEQFRDGDARRVGFYLYLEVPRSLLVPNATFELPHSEMRAVLHHLNDSVGSATENCKGQIRVMSVGDTAVDLKVDLEALVAKKPSTNEAWAYAGNARYVVAALPAGK
jgi:hypothetical protein